MMDHSAAVEIYKPRSMRSTKTGTYTYKTILLILKEPKNVSSRDITLRCIK